MKIETKYTFEVPLSHDQIELIEQYVQSSIGVPRGHKFFATIGLLNKRIVFAIMPTKASKKLDAALQQVSLSTTTVRIDQLSAEDAPRVKHQAVARKAGTPSSRIGHEVRPRLGCEKGVQS